MKKIIKNYCVGLFYTRVRTQIMKNKVNARKRQFMYNNPFIEESKSHECIMQLLANDRPAMIARYGLTEAQVIGKYALKQNKVVKGYGSCGDWLYNTAGFFSKNNQRLEEDLDRFSELMIEDSKQVDLIGASYAFMEDWDINEYCKNAQITEFNNLRIMVNEQSWGQGLQGKKVLVIHPFSESIKFQYSRREYIWKNETILPEFELITYKSIQTIAGNDTDKYEDWFCALDKMKADIRKIDFDIAIIGCGAYGFPLAAECKRMGKKAIHLGGQVQMIFGILGKRWEDIPYYKQFINEYWIHPSQEETPNNFKKVENGCYW